MGQGYIFRLLALTILLLFYTAIGKPAENNRMLSRMNPLVEAAVPVLKNLHHSNVLEKTAYLLSKVESQDVSLRDRLKLINVTNILLTWLENLNVGIDVKHTETLRKEQMLENILQYSRYLHCLLTPVKCKYFGNGLPILTRNNMLPGTVLLELKSKNSAYNSKNNTDNFIDNLPGISSAERVNSRDMTLNNKKDISRTHIFRNEITKQMLRQGIRKIRRTRFARNTDQNVLNEENYGWVNLPLVSDRQAEVEFGMSQGNNVFDKMLQDLARTVDDQFQNLKTQDALDLIERKFQSLPLIYNSPLEDEDVGDSHVRVSEGERGQELSRKNIQEMFLYLLPYSDDDTEDDMGEESTGFAKRDNRYLNKIHALLKEGTNDALRVPLQDRPRRVRLNEKHERSMEKDRPIELLTPREKPETCQPESDGTKPLRCPSDPSRCLYDAMICDGTANCPQGEDETFTLCVLRHWTFRFMKKFLTLS